MSVHSHAECHSTPTAPCRRRAPNLTERAAQNYSLPRYGASAWTDGKLHLEAVVVTATHVLMYQDLKLVRSQTHAEAFVVPADADAPGPHFPGTCLTSGCERMILRDHLWGRTHLYRLCQQLCECRLLAQAANVWLPSSIIIICAIMGVRTFAASASSCVVQPRTEDERAGEIHCSTEGREASFEIGGSGMRIGDVRFFR